MYMCSLKQSSSQLDGSPRVVRVGIRWLITAQEDSIENEAREYGCARSIGTPPIYLLEMWDLLLVTFTCCVLYQQFHTFGGSWDGAVRATFLLKYGSY